MNKTINNIMQERLKEVKSWNRRKIILLALLLCSVAAMAFSFYHFAYGYQQLAILNKKMARIAANENNVKDIWAYTGTGIAVILVGVVLILLLWEIKKRRKLNDAIWLQKEYYRITINSIAEGLIVTGKNGEILHMNPAAENLTGWSNEDVKNLPLETVYKVTNEETGKPFEHIVKRILKTGHIVEFENNTLLQTKNNNRLIISNCGSPLIDKRGNISGTVLLFSDITEKKLTADTLKQNREFLQKTLDLSLDVICTVNATGQFVSMSRASKRILGYEPEELIGKPYMDYVAEADIEKTVQIDSEIVGGLAVTNFENNYKHKNGSLVPVQWSSHWDEESKLIFAVARDITERKKYENRLKASDSFSRGVLDSLSSHIAVINADGSIIKTNAPWINFAVNNGVTNLEKCIEGANYFAAYNKDGNHEDSVAAESIAGIRKVLNSSLAEFYLEYPCSDRNQEKWFFMRAMKFESDETLILIEHHDITERKQAEAKTLAAVERYDILAKATSDTIWDWDIANNKMQYNAAISDMFGYSLSEIDNVYGWWKQNLHPDDVNKVSETVTAVFENEKQTFQLQYRFRCADGIYKYIYDRAFVIYDTNKKPVRVIGAMQDVSYEKEEEIRISKAIIDAQEKERQEIGLELHDNVNQILVGTLLNLGMSGKVTAEKSLQLIEKSTEYVNEAIAEIRKLSHRLAPVTFDDTSLQEIFEGVIKSINVQNLYDCKLHFEGFEHKSVSDDIQVNLLRVLQEQLNNIVKHARAGCINIQVIHSGHEISMRIFDNGIGFNPDKIKRGIGLANIKKRAESLKGRFLLNSKPGNGCEIILEIPLDE